MNEFLTGSLGWKGERGYSAYEIAVQNGYVGSEQDWLASLGDSTHLRQDTATYTTTTANEDTFNLPANYTTDSFVEVYVNGLRLTPSEFTIDNEAETVTLTNPLEVIGTTVEVVVTTVTTNSLPISDTLDGSSTNDTAAGSKVVYDALQTKIDAANIQVLTGSVGSIAAGETIIEDVSYPTGFTKATTVIIGKMTSTNNVYYDTVDLEETENGFPVIDMVALMDDGIRIWLKNTNATASRQGHYKITLMKVGA